eukprot:Rhum_TRINITY_DN14751_c2_g1::Rhum_TRINITY_DN14751_c2_g1_i1::g.113528::m.113528
MVGVGRVLLQTLLRDRRCLKGHEIVLNCLLCPVHRQPDDGRLVPVRVAVVRCREDCDAQTVLLLGVPGLHARGHVVRPHHPLKPVCLEKLPRDVRAVQLPAPTPGRVQPVLWVRVAPQQVGHQPLLRHVAVAVERLQVCHGHVRAGHAAVRDEHLVADDVRQRQQLEDGLDGVVQVARAVLQQDLCEEVVLFVYGVVLVVAADDVEPLRVRQLHQQQGGHALDAVGAAVDEVPVEDDDVVLGGDAGEVQDVQQVVELAVYVADDVHLRVVLHLDVHHVVHTQQHLPHARQQPQEVRVVHQPPLEHAAQQLRHRLRVQHVGQEKVVRPVAHRVRPPVVLEVVLVGQRHLAGHCRLQLRHLVQHDAEAGPRQQLRERLPVPLVLLALLLVELRDLPRLVLVLLLRRQPALLPPLRVRGPGPAAQLVRLRRHHLEVVQGQLRPHEPPLLREAHAAHEVVFEEVRALLLLDVQEVLLDGPLRTLDGLHRILQGEAVLAQRRPALGTPRQVAGQLLVLHGLREEDVRTRVESQVVQSLSLSEELRALRVRLDRRGRAAPPLAQPGGACRLRRLARRVRRRHQVVAGAVRAAGAGRRPDGAEAEALAEVRHVLLQLRRVARRLGHRAAPAAAAACRARALLRVPEEVAAELQPGELRLRGVGQLDADVGRRLHLLDGAVEVDALLEGVRAAEHAGALVLPGIAEHGALDDACTAVAALLLLRRIVLDRQLVRRRRRRRRRRRSDPVLDAHPNKRKVRNDAPPP